MDIYKRAGSKFINHKGCSCHFCDNGLLRDKNRKSKIGRNLLSKLRRNYLKIDLQKEINNNL
jgi:hypothetical protein